MRKWARKASFNNRKPEKEKDKAMSPRPSSEKERENRLRKPSTRRAASNSTDDIIEVEREDSEADEGPKTELPERPKTPAYVAPIPKIGSIGSVPPISPGIPSRPQLPPFVGSFLLGKQVDESGDIIDDKTGQVLARAGGDLPSIVGRRVSNRQGDILGDDGELLGYVADIEIERKGSASGSAPQSPRGPRSLFEIMSRSKAALMVDENGNILDGSGNIVGKFHDNNNPMHREARERQRASQPPEAESAPPSPPPKETEESPEKQPEAEQEQRRPRRTEEERRANAEAWRKEKPGESPSDIFLDVKSTTEGIQLTIRIPTVFGGQQIKPNISFS
ncbi:hypothetical protein QBC47DRAFT_100909 [Echria macrotheca]|uniref:Uncharacterized protein n=1 Tax=Echria macrotheca TaxID=438768 RepID=A0AAJ0FFL8_9PEZI|nr:hypothetical protein QBC47DRAFT_100909 [Echria macrotheca]